MVIFDEKTFTCKIFEIKHSNQIVSQQYATLIDAEKNAQTEKRYGPIIGRYVIYRGQTQEHESGVTYLNVEEYLSFN